MYIRNIERRNIMKLENYKEKECIMCGQVNPLLLEKHHLITNYDDNAPMRDCWQYTVFLCANCHKIADHYQQMERNDGIERCSLCGTEIASGGKLHLCKNHANDWRRNWK